MNGHPNQPARTALIVGVTGQDGAYLAELLLSKGYVVHGLKRRSSSFNTARVDHLYRDPHEVDTRFRLHLGDLADATNLMRVVQETEPDEIYNLGAESHVQVSFDLPEYTADVNALGTLRLLEALRRGAGRRRRGCRSLRCVALAGVGTIVLHGWRWIRPCKGAVGPS